MLSANRTPSTDIASSITTPLNWIEADSDTDTLTVDFIGTPTGPEVTTLNGLVAAHTAVPIAFNALLTQAEKDALSGVTGGKFIQVSPNDTTKGHLQDKLVSSNSNVSFAIANPSADEDLDLSVTGITASGPVALSIGSIPDGLFLRRSGGSIIGASSSSLDELVKVRASDTTASFLNDAINFSSGLNTTINNPGLDESMTITPNYGSSAATITEGNDPRIPLQTENDALQGTDGTPSGANRYVTDSDPRNTNSRVPTGSATGDLSGTYPSPSVSAITTTLGPTSLSIGSVADGEYLQRSGASIIGSTTPGGVFGLNFDYIVKATPVSTTAIDFIDIISLNTGNVTGTFRVFASADMETGNADAEVRILNQTDLVNVGGDTLLSGNNKRTFTRHDYMVLIGSPKTIILQIRSTVAGRQQTIKNAVMEFWRVS